MVSGSRDGTRRNAAEFMAEGLRNSFTAHLEKDFPFSRDACLGDENVPKKPAVLRAMAELKLDRSDQCARPRQSGSSWTCMMPFERPFVECRLMA